MKTSAGDAVPLAATDRPVHLVVVPHTHWDREWYQPFQQFRARLVRLLDRLLDLLEGDPAFAHFHLDGQTIVLEDYLEIRPTQRARLRRLIASGRIAVGPWYVLPDEFLVSGESIIRNLQIGHRIAQSFGASQRIGYLPDQFGHIAQMPQILAGFGIDCAVVWRGVGADVTRTAFTWEAPDGTRAFTVYLLRAGYSNGRSLPRDADALRQRLAEVIAAQAEFRTIPSLLVMNGTDHQEAQGFVPGALALAARGIEGLSYELAPLAHFIARSRAEHDALQVHRGELRSPLRAHLLPGVTSARVRQKQRDFENVSRLERYAEPLATWADLVTGAGRRLSEFTDWAWKLAVQNHPHDSICGCSVDQVHRDMEYRFDQVEQVGTQVIRQALGVLCQRLDTSCAALGTALVVYNPNAAGGSVVHAEVYVDDAAGLRLEDAMGSAVPLHVAAAPRETVFAAEITPAETRPHVQAIEGREFLGYFINDVQLLRQGDRLRVTLTMERTLRGSLDMAGMRARWLAMLDETSLRVVTVQAQSAVPAQLTFSAPLTGHGFTVFAVRSGPSGTAAVPHLPVQSGERSVENRYYRVAINDDGSLHITDKDTGFVLPRCNWFVDEGDRGDEYNFDPLSDPQAVTAPMGSSSVSVEVPDAVGSALTMAHVYRLPRALEADRETRTAQQVDVPIVTRVRLYDQVKRIDFDTTVDNGAADHRLRVHFRTPLTVHLARMEQAFGSVERALDLEPDNGVERPLGTVPQKTFTCIDDGCCGVALFNRGIQEIEVQRTATGTDIALTLLRAVGWLSRGDLRWRNGHAGPGLETPEAQTPGLHRFAYALTTFRGDWQSAGIVAQAHRFAHPPMAVAAEAHSGSLPRDAAFWQIDNPHVVLSAVTPSKRRGAFLARCYNASAQSQTVSIAFPGDPAVRGVNCLEQPVRLALRRSRTGTLQLQLRPFEIVTLAVQPRASKSRASAVGTDGGAAVNG